MIGKFSRRQVIAATGAGLAVSWAPTVSATPEKMREERNKVLGGKPVEKGGITLETPIIAENGGQVPITAIVDSPMTEEDHVRAIHLFAEENPTPIVGSFFFTPESGLARVRLNIRLANSQQVSAIAEMSDGTFRGAEKNIKVTIGGCGGG